MKKFDLYWADYVYDDNKYIKKTRPILVVDNKRYYVVSVKITSHPPRQGWNDYVIQDWKQAGLKVPSTLRLDKVINISKSDFHQYIGHLSNRDISNVKKLLKIK